MGQLGWKDLIGPGGVFLATIITQIVTVTLLFANNRMAYKRSRREKLWDLKRELYSKVVAEVSDIKDHYSKAVALYNIPDIDENLKKSVLEREKAIIPKIVHAQDLFHDNYLILSRAFLRIFQSIDDVYQNDPSRDSKSFGEVLTARKRVVDKLHESLVAQARKELDTGDLK